jgi:archaellin
MGKLFTAGLTSLLLLIALMFIGITVASILTGQIVRSSSEQDLEQMAEKTIDEISTYLLIKDQKGKFNEINGKQKIEKIALWITPLITQEIDLSKLTIQLYNGEAVNYLTYDGNSANLELNSLFDHPIWNNINGSNFGFISIVDIDNSLINYQTFNDCSDNAYVVFRLPDFMTLSKHEEIIVTLFPSTGITRTIELKAPIPINPVVSFE